jgi:hypothetical protein
MLFYFISVEIYRIIEIIVVKLVREVGHLNNWFLYCAVCILIYKWMVTVRGYYW